MSLLAFRCLRLSPHGGFLLQFGLIVINGGTDEILQRSLVNLVALGKIDRSPHLASEARIEELVRIREAGPVGEGKFHLALEDGGNCDQSLARPGWASHPLPTFGDLVVGRQDALADGGKRISTPVRES